MAGSRRAQWRHLWVLALALPLACSSALPAFARWLADSGSHVCACSLSAGHAHCGCPICEHRDDLKSRLASVRPRCGEQDEVFGGVSVPGVVPPPAYVLSPPAETSGPWAAPAPRPFDIFLSPPTPPPRSARS